MAKPTKRVKAAKPHRDFPLFPHATGRWCKKVKGRFAYFGPVTDDGDHGAQDALDRWLAQRDDLLAGRRPRSGPGITLADLANRFLSAKQSLVESGELSPRTWKMYFRACGRVVSCFGRSTPVEAVGPEDFQRLRMELAKLLAPASLSGEIVAVRSLFKFGLESELISRPMRFGPGFARPSSKTLRIAHANGGLRMFEREELLKFLRAAGVNLKAMVLLGVNGGLGNTDCALLPIRAVDLQGGWLDFPRVKTGIPRRIPLWPETVEAIKAVLAARCEPLDPADAHLLFLNLLRGSYVGNRSGTAIANMTGATIRRAGIKRPGLSFYSLRRTFQTIAEGSRDMAAVQSIMGHAPAPGDMSAVYRQRVDDARLRAVVDHVRKWLFGTEETK